MFIKFIEVQNFRKLKSVRVDFAPETTVFVGANNSGKTSAMVALRHFLVDKQCFSSNDFTLSCWAAIDAIGNRWTEEGHTTPPSMSEWESVLPALDVWLQVEPTEIHYVSHLIPTLDWAGGQLGVRLRLEPKNLEAFYREYATAKKMADETINAARQARTEVKYTVALWPATMCEFMERRLHTHFNVQAYSLDPAQLREPDNGMARPQPLPSERDALPGDPFADLILIHEVSAQRGFADATGSGRTDEEGVPVGSYKRKLSEQLRAYYTKHIDPSDMPEPSDVDALQAIRDAQDQFNERLTEGLDHALTEVSNLGYPGVTDLKLALSTKVRMLDGLNHPTALQYKIASPSSDDEGTLPCLPEHYNGLGYQNLISMVFLLMSFRDHWMQVGMAQRRASAKGTGGQRFTPPLHLVLVEEPEAHLHVQVQQVFIRKAYEILRNHPDLQAAPHLKTQLVVTTHSSHIAHESTFASLRYFRRRPPVAPGEVPTSTVVNLSAFFRNEDETQRFVTRYLRTTHCDLFFADAAVLVEGPAERILLPHFIREHFAPLSNAYLTILEIGGSHAHRLRNLIEHLGLLTLIVTDLDACSADGRHPAEQPVRSQGQITRNSTLKSWVPGITEIDSLLTASAASKELQHDGAFGVRVAYQCPVHVSFPMNSSPTEALANTFEDALVFENGSLFANMDGEGMMKAVKTAIGACTSPADLGAQMFQLLKRGDKAEFALNLLFQEDPRQLTVPLYISEGLTWLQEQLHEKQPDAAPAETLTEAVMVAAEMA